LNAKKPTHHCLPAVLEDALSLVLLQEVEIEERLVYFVSQVLHGAEVRYQMIEKVALSLVMTT